MKEEKKFIKYYLKTRGYIYVYLGLGVLFMFSMVVIKNMFLAMIFFIGFLIFPISAIIYMTYDIIKMSITSAKEEINKKSENKVGIKQ